MDEERKERANADAVTRAAIKGPAPKLDPLFYLLNSRYGKWTRMRAAAVAFDMELIDKDQLIDAFDELLNPTV